MPQGWDQCSSSQPASQPASQPVWPATSWFQRNGHAASLLALGYVAQRATSMLQCAFLALPVFAIISPGLPLCGLQTKTYHAPPFLVTHWVNAFESSDGRYLHLDACCTDTPALLTHFDLNTGATVCAAVRLEMCVCVCFRTTGSVLAATGTRCAG
jgi:hypothetical protein